MSDETRLLYWGKRQNKNGFLLTYLENGVVEKIIEADDKTKLKSKAKKLGISLDTFYYKENTNE